MKKNVLINCQIWCLLIGWGWAQGGAAQPAVFQRADQKLGRHLIQENHCSDCHAQRVGGDGHAIYRPKGKINTPSALQTMVESCNVQLGLQLFPEEVTAISAVLNQDFYKFK
jgi:hypothetical protein